MSEEYVIINGLEIRIIKDEKTINLSSYFDILNLSLNNIKIIIGIKKYNKRK